MKTLKELNEGKLNESKQGIKAINDFVKAYKNLGIYFSSLPEQDKEDWLDEFPLMYPHEDMEERILEVDDWAKEEISRIKRS
tara:strand:- start:152 stop:397 length:246 start_codon:yes stop_codon:yes gene_type:complete